MKNLFFAFFAFIFLTTSCSTNKSGDFAPSMAKESVAPADYYMEEDARSSSIQMKTVANQGDARITEQTKVQPKIIKDASVRFQVEDYQTVRATIDAAIQAANAYVTSEDESKSGYSWENNMVIRVPSENFDSLLDQLGQIAIYTDHKRINAKDVTAEYIDIEARLNNRKEVEKRFREILQQAKNIKEILEVENEIRKIREEIDAAEGRLKYLRDQVAYSTINLGYYQKLDYKAAPERSYFTKIGKAFSEGWNGFLEFTIALVYAWPLWIVLVGVVWLVNWLSKRRKTQEAK